MAAGLGRTYPILSKEARVNRTFPSGSAAMNSGLPEWKGSGNSVKTPRRGDSPDLAADELSEPQVAVGAGQDAIGGETMPGAPMRPPLRS
jgi:hypothetical protein